MIRLYFGNLLIALSQLLNAILGGDPDAGAIALGAFPRVGQTLQFQLRDGDTADEDLRAIIATLE